MTLIEWIERLSDTEVRTVFRDRCASAGHNGPYFEQETCVRNTGHWLITFSKLYKIAGRSELLDTTKICSDYLLSREARPQGHTFHHHKKGSRDMCNGLIGQAWSIEALVEAENNFPGEAYRRVAEDVFLQHPFEWNAGLWSCKEVDGSLLPVDITFNHQLWFAVAGAMIGSDTVDARVRQFLTRLDDNLALHANGLISHLISYIPQRRIAVASLSGSGTLMKRTRLTLGNLIGRKATLDPRGSKPYMKCVGYHSFSTYALALLKEQWPDDPVWQNRALKRVVAFLKTEDFESDLDREKTYGYPYNAPGFEVPFSLYRLDSQESSNAKDTTAYWMRKQLRRTWDDKRGAFRDDVADPVTLAARAYELTRLPDDVLLSVNL